MQVNRRVPVIVLLAVLLGTLSAHSQRDQRRDGNWWNQQDRTTKAAYVVGFFDGIFLGNQFSYWELVEKAEANGTQSDKDTAFTRLNHSFERYRAKYLGNVSNLQVADGLDEFYKNFRNRSINVNDAVWPVLRQIAGDPTPEINSLIENLRKNAQNN